MFILGLECRSDVFILFFSINSVMLVVDKDKIKLLLGGLVEEFALVFMLLRVFPSLGI